MMKKTLGMTGLFKVSSKIIFIEWGEVEGTECSNS